MGRLGYAVIKIPGILYSRLSLGLLNVETRAAERLNIPFADWCEPVMQTLQGTVVNQTP